MCSHGPTLEKFTRRDVAGSLDVDWFRKRYIEMYQGEYLLEPDSRDIMILHAYAETIKIMHEPDTGHVYLLIHVSRLGRTYRPTPIPVLVLRSERIVYSPADIDIAQRTTECQKGHEGDGSGDRKPPHIDGRCQPPSTASLTAPVSHDHVVVYSPSGSGRSSYVRKHDQVMYTCHIRRDWTKLEDVVAAISGLNYEPLDDAHPYRRSFWYAAVLARTLAGYRVSPTYCPMRPPRFGTVSLELLQAHPAAQGEATHRRVRLSQHGIHSLFAIVTGENLEQQAEVIKPAIIQEELILGTRTWVRNPRILCSKVDVAQRRVRELEKEYGEALDYASSSWKKYAAKAAKNLELERKLETLTESELKAGLAGTRSVPTRGEEAAEK